MTRCQVYFALILGTWIWAGALYQALFARTLVKMRLQQTKSRHCIWTLWGNCQETFWFSQDENTDRWQFVILSTSWIRAPQPDVMTSGCPFCSEANLSKSLRSPLRPLPRLKPENGPFLLPLCQNVPQLPQLSKTHTNICLDIFCTAESCLIYICILTSPSNWKMYLDADKPSTHAPKNDFLSAMKWSTFQVWQA